MSSCGSITEILRQKFLRRKQKLKTRHYFSLWKRNESDALRAAILTHLGYSYKGSPYGTFLTIDEVPHDSHFRTLCDNRQARALFSKDEDMLSPIDKRAVALDGFMESERSCKMVNQQFRDGYFAKSDVALIIWYAQRKIVDILGPAPCLSDLQLTFGSGASTSCNKQKVSARWKLSCPPSISKSAVTALRALISTLPMYFTTHKKVEIHNGKLDFVPKNYKTMRPICIEPTVNTMVQRGIGAWMKDRLLHSGINLFNQGINYSRARKGSLTGSLGTIDLEKASDSVSYNLVMELLPWEWFDLLDTFRTPIVEYKGTMIPLEKFSGMGNGYTFELESLIFYSLAYGIARLKSIPFDLTVYGDDLVAGTQLCKSIIDLFPQFGFSVNSQKSFLEGPFRESCGGDFVTGVDVRPFFLKGRFSHHKVVCFYNFLVRKPWFDPEGALRRTLLSTLPLEYRLYGPDGYGDGHLITDDLAAHLVPYKRNRGYSGYTFRTFVARKKRITDMCNGDQLLPSYCSSLYRDFDPLSDRLESHAPDHYSVRNSPNDQMSSKIANVYVFGPL